MRVLCGQVGAPAFSIFRTVCQCIRQPGHVANCSCSCGLSFKSESNVTVKQPAVTSQKELALT